MQCDENNNCDVGLGRRDEWTICSS